MLDFIVKYWVEFLFGLMAAGITLFLKEFLRLYKREHQDAQKEICTILRKEMGDMFNQSHKEILTTYQLSQQDDKKLQAQINSVQEEMKSLKKGLLSMQGKQFKQECRALLEDGHEITLDEFQELDADHQAYNALGGNHNGDHLFELVKKKVENTLTTN